MDYEIPPLIDAPHHFRLAPWVAQLLTEQARACRDTGLLLDQMLVLQERATADTDDARPESAVEDIALRRSAAIGDLIDQLQWVLIDATAAYAIEAAHVAAAILDGRAPEAKEPATRAVAIIDPGAIPIAQVGADADPELRDTHRRLLALLDALRARASFARTLEAQGQIIDPLLLDFPTAAHAYASACCWAVSRELRGITLPSGSGSSSA